MDEIKNEEVAALLEYTQLMLTKLPLDIRVHLLGMLCSMASCYVEEKNHAVLVFVEDERVSSTALFNTTFAEAQHILSETLPRLAQMEKDHYQKQHGEIH